MRTETIVLNKERNVTLTAYIQEVDGEFGFSKRPTMLILPGGGYSMCSDREADPVAMAYLKAGFQAFILRYTVKSYGAWPLPLEDYEQAMSMIKDNEEKWHVDPDRIGIVGFSAGGHLAACTATVAKTKPAAAILVYPAILKDICDMCQPGMPYPHEHVTHETCPCFVVAARDDRVVNIKNALMMDLALAENNIPFESHIYSYGGHGFSTAEEWIITNSVSKRVPNWVPDSIQWLGEVWGGFTRNGYTEPVESIQMNCDFAPVLSIECSLAHINKQSDKVKSVLSPMYRGIEFVAKERGFDVQILMNVLGTSPVREIMETIQMSKDEIKEIDKILHGIVNEL